MSIFCSIKPFGGFIGDSTVIAFDCDGPDCAWPPSEQLRLKVQEASPGGNTPYFTNQFN